MIETAGIALELTGESWPPPTGRAGRMYEATIVRLPQPRMSMRELSDALRGIGFEFGEIRSVEMFAIDQSVGMKVGLLVT